MTTEKILIVEDNPINRELLRDLLRARGYKVWEAATGPEALRLVKASPPDLVVMDLQLPGIDGLAVTRAIKAEATTRHVPVVALTAHARKSDEAKAYEAGCSAYIAKPMDTRAFVRLVATLLGPQEGGGHETISTQA